MLTNPGMSTTPSERNDAVASDARRDDAHAAIGVVGLHGDLVEEVEPADLHRLDLAQTEVEEDRLLHPLVDHPAACCPRRQRVRHLGRARRSPPRSTGGSISSASQSSSMRRARSITRASSPIGLVRKRSSTSYAVTSASIGDALVRMVCQRRVTGAEVDGVEPARREVGDVRPRLLRADLEVARALERANGGGVDDARRRRVAHDLERRVVGDEAGEERLCVRPARDRAG